MNPPRHILASVDLGDQSPDVLEYARMLTDCCGATLHVLHVIPDAVRDGDTTERCRGAALAQLRALVERSVGPGRPVTVDCIAGPTTYAITDYAADHAIDLIVMGTHRHGPRFQMATGSICESVLGRAPCPVVAVTAHKT